MKKVIDKSDSRGHSLYDWLDSHHTFSFDEYYNPRRMNFGALRVLNDDRVAPGKGFGTHPHKNMEIISIPLKGNCFPNLTSRLPPEAYFMTKQEKGYEPRKKSQTRTVKSEKAVPLSKRGKFTKAIYSQPKTSVSKQKRS